jgi:hypothetical protein
VGVLFEQEPNRLLDPAVIARLQRLTEQFILDVA